MCNSQQLSYTCMFGPHLESDMSSCNDLRTCRDSRNKTCDDQCSGIYCCDGSCLPLQWVNDGEIDCNICGYSSGRIINDESEIINKYLQKNITCALICNQTKCVRFSQLNDGRNDCRGPEGPLDETIGKLESAETCRNILDHIIWAPRCVYVKDMYGAVIGCRDMSHLRNCTDFMCPEGYVKCPDTYCIPQHYVLDGKADCPTGEEENNENIDSCSGNFDCWNSTIYLHPDLVCDGHPECPHQDDEVDCDMLCEQGFQCVSGTITVSDYNISVPLTYFVFLDIHFKYIDLSGVDLSGILYINEEHLLNCVFINWSRCNLKNLPRIKEKHRSILHPLDMEYSSVEQYNDKCQPTLGNLRHFNLSYNNELVVNYLNLPFLEVLDLSHTAQSYIDYDFLIRLPMLRHLNLSFTLISSVHKQSFSSQYNLQTLDLRCIPLDDFHEDLFNGLTISQHMYTDKFEMCCLQIRGDNIPDYMCHSPEDEIASCYELLRDDAHRVTLLVIAVLAVLENLTLIVYRVLCDRSALRTAYGQFVTNLCISDLIKGIYACIIVGADYKYRDVYALYNTSWRESLVCKLAGFLATLSSETSIYFIFLSTFNIFLKKQMTHMQIIIAVILSWTLCFLLALLPLVLKFDIYSSNSICLGLPITKQVFKDGWEYSFCLFIAHNLCIVLAVAYGQKVILRSMPKNTISNTATISSSNRPQDTQLAKQLSLVAMLTCLTWFYIGIMGLLSLGEHEISNEVYAWTTVIILPVHSAANPILYTIPAFLARWEKFKHGN